MMGRIAGAWGRTHDQRTGWRGWLMPNLVARLQAREAARERGPPGSSHGHEDDLAGWPRGSAALQGRSRGHLGDPRWRDEPPPRAPGVIHDHGTACPMMG